MLRQISIKRSSVPEPPGIAIFKAAPEPVPEPFFGSVGAESRSRLFKAALAPSFIKAEKKSLVLVLGINSIYRDKRFKTKYNISTF